MILRAIFTEVPAELANLDKNPEGWGVLACCCRSQKSSSNGLRAQFWCAISAVRLGVAIDGRHPPWAGVCGVLAAMKIVEGLAGMERTPTAILCDSSYAVDDVQCNSRVSAHTMVVHAAKCLYIR